jgi:uncharacterized membrane protein YidH (DUF202 family)
LQYPIVVKPVDGDAKARGAGGARNRADRTRTGRCPATAGRRAGERDRCGEKARREGPTMAWLRHHLSAVVAYLVWVAFGSFGRRFSRPTPRGPIVARRPLIGAIGLLAVALVVAGHARLPVCATVTQPARRRSKGFPRGSSGLVGEELPDPGVLPGQGAAGDDPTPDSPGSIWRTSGSPSRTREEQPTHGRLIGLAADGDVRERLAALRLAGPVHPGPAWQGLRAPAPRPSYDRDSDQERVQTKPRSETGAGETHGSAWIHPQLTSFDRLLPMENAIGLA